MLTIFQVLFKYFGRETLLTLITTLRSKYNYDSHFIGEESKVQRG